MQNHKYTLKIPLKEGYYETNEEFINDIINKKIAEDWEDSLNDLIEMNYSFRNGLNDEFKNRYKDKSITIEELDYYIKISTNEAITDYIKQNYAKH
jgi:hypothetical protein